jgi:spoIIIJ-associated protein
MSDNQDQPIVAEDAPATEPTVSVESTEQGLEEAILYAKKYLEDLLSFMGLNTDVYATHEDEVIQLNVPSTQMNGFLIGQHGDNMRAMQFLVSSALKNQNHPYNRVNVDVAGYKQQRADRLAATAEDWIKQVRSSGQPMELRPMNAADRRVVHKVAAESGLNSDSVGEGRDRRIVIKPDEADTAE